MLWIFIFIPLVLFSLEFSPTMVHQNNNIIIDLKGHLFTPPLLPDKAKDLPFQYLLSIINHLYLIFNGKKFFSNELSIARLSAKGGWMGQYTLLDKNFLLLTYFSLWMVSYWPPILRLISIYFRGGARFIIKLSFIVCLRQNSAYCSV